MTTPTTEAGKRLAQVTSYQEQPEMVGAILAIEIEAAATEKARADALELENTQLRGAAGRVVRLMANPCVYCRGKTHHVIKDCPVRELQAAIARALEGKPRG